MVQQKFINRYVNVSKTTKLCQHKYKTQGQHVQPAFTSSKPTIKTPKQGVKYVQR